MDRGDEVETRELASCAETGGALSILLAIQVRNPSQHHANTITARSSDVGETPSHVRWSGGESRGAIVWAWVLTIFRRRR